MRYVLWAARRCKGDTSLAVDRHIEETQTFRVKGHLKTSIREALKTFRYNQSEA
jgi:hypothetical protein